MVEIQNTVKAPKTFPEIWQPIASAPRDGTFVLTKSGPWQPCITHFATYDGRTRWGSSPEGFMTEEEFLRYWHEISYEPTEWMSLPTDDVADAIETAYRNGFEDGERHAGEAAAPQEHREVFEGSIDTDTPLQAAAREAGWALTTLVDISDWQRRDQLSDIIGRLAAALLDGDAPAPQPPTPPAAITRELLGQIVDEVFDGGIEDASVIEDIYRVIARRYGPAPQEHAEGSGAHPDDLAVDRFTTAMKAKLARKRDEGYSGWEDAEQCSMVRLLRLLEGHILKGDPVDVSNIAMMIHQRAMMGLVE